MKKSSWIQSSWTVGIGTAVFSLLLTMGYDYSKEKPILTTIWASLKCVLNFIWEILDYDLKVWWVLLAAILFFLAIHVINRFHSLPDFYSYREDKFQIWKWSWEWEWNSYENKWRITNLKAHCPSCDTPMIKPQTLFIRGHHLECPRCDFKAQGDQYEEPHKIERIIVDNIERKGTKGKQK